MKTKKFVAELIAWVYFVLPSILVGYGFYRWLSPETFWQRFAALIPTAFSILLMFLFLVYLVDYFEKFRR